MTAQGFGGQLIAAGSRASSSSPAKLGREKAGGGAQGIDFETLEVDASTLAVNGF